MAKIIDQERQETVEETTQEPVQEEFDLDQAVVSEEPQQPQPDKVEELPEKYKNKSAINSVNFFWKLRSKVC